MVSRAKLTQHTGKPGLLRLFFAIGTVAGTVLARENAAPAPGLISKYLDASYRTIRACCRVLPMRSRRLLNMWIVFDCAGFLIAGIMLYEIPCNPGILGIERVNKMLRKVYSDHWNFVAIV
jgi:hypothetical protein